MITYEYVKRIVEGEYGLCKFTKNVNYTQRDRSITDDSMLKTLVYMSKYNVLTLLAEHVYFKRVVSEDVSVIYKKRRFTDKWIEDLDKEIYRSVDVYPGAGVLSDKMYKDGEGLPCSRYREISHQRSATSALAF